MSPANSCCSGEGKRKARVRSVARTVSSRCRINGQAMELVNGHETLLALSNRGAFSILDASFKFTRASHLVSGEPWSTVRKEQRAFKGVFSAVIEVCAGLLCASVRMRPKKGSLPLFVKDVVSLPRKLAVSRNGQGSRAVPCPSVPGRVRSAPSRQMLFRRVRVRTRMRCPLPEGESRADLEVSLQPLDPSGWKLAAYGGFFRVGNIFVLETRSILYAVLYAESNYPPGRFLILLKILHWCWHSAKDAQTFLQLLSVMRRIIASGFRAPTAYRRN